MGSNTNRATSSAAASSATARKASPARVLRMPHISRSARRWRPPIRWNTVGVTKLIVAIIPAQSATPYEIRPT